MSNEETSLPLSGLRVLDLTTTIFGPYTTQILGDFGADVIKIEAPGGDLLRDIEPARNPGMGAVYLSSNRNKRSVLLDLKRDEGREALWALVDTADAFVHNMRQQKMSALGFSAKAVRERNPKIVYAALVGYSSQGPYGNRPAYDDVVQGECGIAASFALRDGEPAFGPTVFVDKTAAQMASNAILAALLQRERTGDGVTLESAMFETMVSYMLVDHHCGEVFSPPEAPMGYPRVLSQNRKPFETRDGHICMLAYTDRQWQRFWEVAGRPELATDERFATVGARSLNIDALYAIAADILRERTSVEWLDALHTAEIPSGPVNSFEDLRSDPHLEAVGFYRSYDHPSEGAIEIPDTGYRFDGRQLPVRHHPPQLGEQTEEILRDAGLSDEQIAKVKV